MTSSAPSRPPIPRAAPAGKGSAAHEEEPEDEEIAKRVRASLKVLPNVWSDEACAEIEAEIENVSTLAKAGRFKPKTVDRTPLRAKYFFGYGYTYGSQISSKGGEQLLPPGMVDPIPAWIQDKLIRPLEISGLVEPGWINSAVVNDYRPGGMIVSHIDPPKLFARPIYISSFFAPGRLVFGSRFTFPNKGGAPECTPPKCMCPMPRGSVTIMEGYSADGITHGIRPVDLDGRRVSIVLRHVFKDAPKLGDTVDPQPALQITPPRPMLQIKPPLPRIIPPPGKVLPEFPYAKGVSQIQGQSSPGAVVHGTPPSLGRQHQILPAAFLGMGAAQLHTLQALARLNVDLRQDVAPGVLGISADPAAGAGIVAPSTEVAASERRSEVSDDEEELDEFGRRRLRTKGTAVGTQEKQPTEGEASSEQIQDKASVETSGRKRGAAAMSEKQKAALERLNKRVRRASD